MSYKLFDHLPACDFCADVSCYDTPMKSGSWAFVCSRCLEKYGRGDHKHMGTELRLRQKQSDKKSNEILFGIEETDMESLIVDEERYVGCPACGESRHVELDADYTFVCEGCESTIKCKAII